MHFYDTLIMINWSIVKVRFGWREVRLGGILPPFSSKVNTRWNVFDSFSPFTICTSTVSLCLAFPLPVHIWRCFWKNVYESLSLRHYKTVHEHPFIVEMSLTLLVLLNCNCSLSSARLYLQHLLGYTSSYFKLVSI